jgi:hypothetical protein
VRVGRLRTRVNSIGFLGLTSDVVMTKRNEQPQPPHVNDRIVKRFDLNDTVVVKVPIDPGFTLTAEDFEEVPSEEMKNEYRSLIGSIGYCAISVRFDIAYAVSVLSRHLAKPCKKVVLAAKRVIKYVVLAIWPSPGQRNRTVRPTGS